MIRRGLSKGQAEEFFKRQPVIDLIFEFGIVIDACPVGPEDRTGAEPLLQQYAFKQQHRGISISAFAAGTYGVVT